MGKCLEDLVCECLQVNYPYIENLLMPIISVTEPNLYTLLQQYVSMTAINMELAWNPITAIVNRFGLAVFVKRVHTYHTIKLKHTLYGIAYSLYKVCVLGGECITALTSSNCAAICFPPCQNGGLCVLPGTCHCPLKYEGHRCQTLIGE